MKLHHSLDSLPKFFDGCAATIGNFDGVHLGHQSLINHTTAWAKNNGVPSVLVTFDPHPLRLLQKNSSPPLLMTTESKIASLGAFDIDHCLVLPFDMPLASMEPEHFVRSILVDGLQTRHLTIGYDYSFGKARAGNSELLQRLGNSYSFSLDQMPPVSIEGTTVSSTAIRSFLAEGLVEDAAKMLGRPHFSYGFVTQGKNRGGKTLGFPTANFGQEKDFLLPANGVYAVLAEIEPEVGAFSHMAPLSGNILAGVANVGSNPTFNDAFVHVETFLFDFDRDIYGSAMRVYFMHRLRGEKKFDSIQSLTAQITEDVAAARVALQNQPHREPIPVNQLTP